MNNRIYIGQAEAGLIAMKESGIKADMCVTSPPYYGLRSYNHDGQIGLEKTPKEFIDKLVGVFSRVWDVLDDRGTLWVNIGDSYATSGGPNPPQTKWDVNGASDTQNGGKSRRIPSMLKNKDLIGIPWMLAFALRDAGWYLRQDIIWSKPNPMPESVTDRCTKAHEYVFMLSKSPRYHYDANAIKQPPAESTIGRSPVAFGGSKGTQYKRNIKESDPNYRNGSEQWGRIYDYNSMSSNGVNKRSVWDVATKPYKGAHFAVFPEELIEPCILAGCPPGGTVLDPFMGSGTTAAVAIKLGRKFLGCDLSYENLQRERLGLFQMDTEWIRLESGEQTSP
jgi:DNA modification methylase